MKHKILVLDGDHKNALAIIRHLGKTREYSINTAVHSKNSICTFSKYVHKSRFINNPKTNPEQYFNDLIKLLKEEDYAVLIPVSYISYQICSNNKAIISKYTKLTIANSYQIQIASSKVQTYNLAEELGIPYPKITTLNSVNDVDNITPAYYPCVIKAPFEMGKNIVEYAQNRNDLIKKFKRLVKENDFGKTLPIIQNFIIGDGVGFFALYKNGECMNHFVHKRIREYPVTGGASTVAQSFSDDTIVRNGKKILDYLKWEGVAMVEFKKDNSTGEYNLMEINAKFWGSLELALVAGVNFPKMLIDDALGKKITPIKGYKQVKFQWLLNGDLFHLIERPWKIFSFIGSLFTSKNDFYLTDIRPNLFQFIYIPVHYYKKLFK